MAWRKLTVVLAGGVLFGNAVAAPQGAVGQVQELVAACDLQAARAIAEQRLASQPGDAEALSALGLIKLFTGKTGDALETLEQAVAAQPDLAVAWFNLGRVLSVHVNDVGMLSKLGVAKRMRDAFARAAELEPQSVEYRGALMQYYAGAPGIAGGDMDKAKSQVAAIKALDPVAGLYYEGFLAFGDKRKEDAARLMGEAAAKGHVEAQRSLAGIHAQAKRWDEAFAVLDGVLTKDPANAPALSLFGYLAAQSGQRLERGAAALRDYLKHPRAACDGGGPRGLAWAHFNLGTIYRTTQREDEARAEYRAALKLHPEFEDAEDALEKLDEEPRSSLPR